MKISPHDKKAYIAIIITAILSVVNALIAFAVGAWTPPILVIPAIPLSAVFVINQFILIIAFVVEFAYWLEGPKWH